MLAWMVNDKGIEPHVPVWDKTQRKDGTLSSSEFVWDEQANEYRCPQGQPLRSDWRPFKNPRTHITQAGTIVYRASQHDCAGLPTEAAVLPQHTDPQDRTQRPRGSPRRGSRINASDQYRAVAASSARRSRCCSPISSAS